MTRRIVTAMLVLLCARPALADGGTVIARSDGGGLLITVFASALRTGVVDLSVMLQNHDGLDPVLDANVELTLTSPDGREMTIAATRAQAQNKLLYATPVTLDHGGRWSFSMLVTRTGFTRSASGSFDVTASGALAYWKYLAIPPVFLLVFTAHQWLSRRQGRVGPRDLPVRNPAAG